MKYWMVQFKRSATWVVASETYEGIHAAARQLLENGGINLDASDIKLSLFSGKPQQVDGTMEDGQLVGHFKGDERLIPSDGEPWECPPAKPDGEPFSLSRFQREQAEWSKRNFGKHEWVDPMLGVVEEVGELSHALLKQKQGIRGSHAEHEAEAQDAVGDIIVYLADLCTTRGWNLEEIVSDTWVKVQHRDWQKHPGDGGS